MRNVDGVGVMTPMTPLQVFDSWARAQLSRVIRAFPEEGTLTARAPLFNQRLEGSKKADR